MDDRAGVTDAGIRSIFLRGQTPELISVLLANTALSASLSFFVAAIGEFQQHSLQRKLLFAPPIILAVVSVF